jgi:hypothetical protein
MLGCCRWDWMHHNLSGIDATTWLAYTPSAHCITFQASHQMANHLVLPSGFCVTGVEIQGVREVALALHNSIPMVALLLLGLTGLLFLQMSLGPHCPQSPA